MESFVFAGGALSLNQSTFFAINCGAVFAGFFICLFFAVFKRNFSLKRRAWFSAVLLSCCALLKARAYITGEKDLSYLLFAVGLIMSVPLFYVRVRRADKSEENARRNLVRFIDGKIKNASALRAEESAEKVDGSLTYQPKRRENTEILKATVTENTGNRYDDDLDFTHVKNVLKRLELSSLSYADRRQMHELELALYEAERGDGGEEVKTKINEGLGNLLKIMSKHGV